MEGMVQKLPLSNTAPQQAKARPLQAKAGLTHEDFLDAIHLAKWSSKRFPFTLGCLAPPPTEYIWQLAIV